MPLGLRVTRQALEIHRPMRLGRAGIFAGTTADAQRRIHDRRAQSFAQQRQLHRAARAIIGAGSTGDMIAVNDTVLADTVLADQVGDAQALSAALVPATSAAAARDQAASIRADRDHADADPPD